MVTLIKARFLFGDFPTLESQSTFSIALAGQEALRIGVGDYLGL
jgi:hypothetical protein